MKTNAKKMILLTGMLYVICLAACSCGSKETPASDRQQEDTNEIAPENHGESPASSPKSEMPSVPGNEDGKAPADTTVVATDDMPDLEGDVKELQEGRLTVVEAITKQQEDGGTIMIAPGDGDDSAFNKVTVTYDENTSFSVRNIYDGGARAETENADSSALEEGQLVHVWGSFSEGELKAAQICIIKVL